MLNFLEITSLITTGKSRHNFKIFDNKIGLNMREQWSVACAQV